MAEIVTIGEAMTALVPKAPGFLRYVRDFELRIAGAESNLAIGAAKLGHSAGWVSSVGKDEFGYFTRNSIRSEGVDTEWVRFDPDHSTGVIFKQVQASSETSVFYYRENSAASHMDESILDEGYIRDARVLHMTGITPVLSSSCEAMVWKAMELARSHGTAISFDPNIRRKLWQDKDYSPMMKEMTMNADIVLMSLDEAKELFDMDETDRILEYLFSKGNARFIAIKDGARGAVVANHDKTVAIPAFPCHCVDPIGAGDAFNAAFLCGLLEGREVGESGRMGGLAGALATENYGDTEGYPSRETLDAALGSQTQN